METLFVTEQNNLTNFFETVSVDDIQDCCGSKVFRRGVEYFENDSVEEASYNLDKTRLKLLVNGSSDYSVVIELQKGEVAGKCNCPYGGIIASLLYAKKESSVIDIVPDSQKAGANIDQYIQSLSKVELIGLVKKFAPEQFWVEVNNKHSDSSFAQNTFKKVESNLQKLFKNNDNLYDPNTFESSLVKGIKKLSGLEKQLKDEIGELIFYIINEVDFALNEGYLYDHYNDYMYEPSDEFIEFISNYVRCLGYKEKTTFLIKLDELLKQQSYDIFDNLERLSEVVFTEDDLPQLKEMLVGDYQEISNQLVEKYYERVRHLLADHEKEIILSKILNNNSKWVIELVGLYDSKKEVMKAIDTLKDWIAAYDANSKDAVFSLYLDLLAKVNLNLSGAAREAISHCPSSSMLIKIASMMKDDLSGYELILEKKNAEELLDYLEKKKRLPEALALINRNKGIWDERVFSFFKKHKIIFPADAEKYFTEKISENLEVAGNSNYQAIANNIEQLKKINPSLAQVYLSDIRLNYKRRRNLITILSKL
jgi:hypothetical protein